ncbi:PEP-CTERM sorting domain-containing protein [Trichormus azollae]|jgi:hypothetical protein|uniref:Uncharacterized protein n=1 Tax=Nostoc azollae (strain 0708) TaxID=551115 RepID=D7E0U5_NOSA0|nr:PEP-CTERM sorting domain-containing protein [Trichormus azollae]ADI63074.1 protein of unknown function DUF1555 ['Nostoc azollae' 0708]
MFNFKSELLGAAAVLPIAAAGFLGSAGSAQALTLNGSIGINGTAIVPSDGVNPATTSVTFVDVDGVDLTGDFANFTPNSDSNTLAITGISITTLNLTRTAIISAIRATYLTGTYTPFIDFGERTLDGVTAFLTFDLDYTEVTITQLASNNISDVTLDGLTGRFNFDGVTVATGFLNASLSGISSTYQLTIVTDLTPIPEPTTMLGLGLFAAGMTVARRRQLVKA